MFQFFVIALILQNSFAQLGQDDADYYDQYEPDIVETTDEGSTSSLSSSNLQKYVPLEDAQTCLESNCAEEIVACKHNEDCLGNYGRFQICYNSTLSFKNCKEPLLNSIVQSKNIQCLLIDKILALCIIQHNCQDKQHFIV